MARIAFDHLGKGLDTFMYEFTVFKEEDKLRS